MPAGLIGTQGERQGRHWRDPALREKVAGWARPACGWHEARRLTVARFGDNRRQVAVTEGDKVEAQLQFKLQREQVRRRRSRRFGARRPGRRRRPSAPGVRGELTSSRRTRSHRSAPRFRSSRLRESRRVPPRLARTGRLPGASTPIRSRICNGLSQLPGSQQTAVDERTDGFGFEAEERLEGPQPSSEDPQDGGRRVSPAAPPSWRTTTYDLSADGPLVLGAHMLRDLPLDCLRQPVLRDPSALDRRAQGPCPPSCSPRLLRARRSSLCLLDSNT